MWCPQPSWRGLQTIGRSKGAERLGDLSAQEEIEGLEQILGSFGVLIGHVVAFGWVGDSVEERQTIVGLIHNQLPPRPDKGVSI